MSIGLGELGLNPWELYRYSLEEFMQKMRGYRNAQQEQWQHTRALAFVIAKPHLKSKNMKIERFWPMPGDEQSGISAMKSREEKMKAFQELRQWYVDHGHLSNN